MDSAVSYFLKALDEDPSNPEPVINLCNIYIKAGQVNSARKILDHCLKIYPNNAKVQKLYHLLSCNKQRSLSMHKNKQSRTAAFSISYLHKLYEINTMPWIHLFSHYSSRDVKSRDNTHDSVFNDSKLWEFIKDIPPSHIHVTADDFFYEPGVDLFTETSFKMGHLISLETNLAVSEKKVEACLSRWDLSKIGYIIVNLPLSTDIELPVILPCLKMLKQATVPFIVKCTGPPEKKEKIKESVNTLIKEGYGAMVAPMKGRWKGRAFPLDYTAEEILDLLEMIALFSSGIQLFGGFELQGRNCRAGNDFFAVNLDNKREIRSCCHSPELPFIPEFTCLRNSKREMNICDARWCSNELMFMFGINSIGHEIDRFFAICNAQATPIGLEEFFLKILFFKKRGFFVKYPSKLEEVIKYINSTKNISLAKYNNFPKISYNGIQIPPPSNKLNNKKFNKFIMHFAPHFYQIGHIAMEPFYVHNYSKFAASDYVILSPSGQKYGNKHLLDIVSRSYNIVSLKYFSQIWKEIFQIHVKNKDRIEFPDRNFCITRWDMNNSYFTTRVVKLSRTRKIPPDFLSLSQEEEEMGRNIQLKLGIPLDAPFVCLHNRESQPGTASYNARQRDGDIRSFIPAISFLLSEGYWVIRIGSDSMPPLSNSSVGKHPHLIDLPFDLKPNDGLADIWFSIKSKFMIANSSGPMNLPVIFNGPPRLLVNMIGSPMPSFNPNDRQIFKRIRTNGNRFLTYSEIFHLQSKAQLFYYDKNWKKRNLFIENNSAEEILSAVKEIEADVRMNRTIDLENSEQKRFREITRNLHEARSIHTQGDANFIFNIPICNSYLTRSSELISSKDNVHHFNNSLLSLKELKLKLIVRNAAFPENDPGGNDLFSHYDLREREIELPLRETALILIDLWDVELPRFQESKRVNLAKKIEPILRLARELDMVVLHCPHRPIDRNGKITGAPSYGGAGPSERSRFELPVSVKRQRHNQNGDQWPPLEFVYRVGKYSQYSRYSRPSYIPDFKISGIAREVLPKKRNKEFIVSELAEVKKILRTQGIFHLLYVGGATNICVVRRPAGMRNMSALGYNTIIVRGATIGHELNSTFESMAVTESSILDIEINDGFSVSKENLLNALGSLNASFSPKK